MSAIDLYRNLTEERQEDVAFVCRYFEGFWGALQSEHERKILYRFILMASQSEEFSREFESFMEDRWIESEELAKETEAARKWPRSLTLNDAGDGLRESTTEDLRAEIAFRDFHYDFQG